MFAVGSDSNKYFEFALLSNAVTYQAHKKHNQHPLIDQAADGNSKWNLNRLDRKELSRILTIAFFDSSYPNKVKKGFARLSSAMLTNTNNICSQK